MDKITAGIITGMHLNEKDAILNKLNENIENANTIYTDTTEVEKNNKKDAVNGYCDEAVRKINIAKDEYLRDIDSILGKADGFRRAHTEDVIAGKEAAVNNDEQYVVDNAVKFDEAVAKVEEIRAK